MQERFQAIADFAEIGTFMEQPVKTYSSGMFMRLAFAVAVNVDPDILLVDEALSVGDLIFQHRCMHRMNKLRAEGKTIVLVTHDLGAVTKFCDRGLLLDGGRLLEDGSPETVVQKYRALSFERERRYGGFDDGPVGDCGPERRTRRETSRWPPAFRISITGSATATPASSGVDLLDERGQPTRDVFGGQQVVVRVTACFHRDGAPAHPRLHAARPARGRDFSLQHLLRRQGSARGRARDR